MLLGLDELLELLLGREGLLGTLLECHNGRQKGGDSEIDFLSPLFLGSLVLRPRVLAEPQFLEHLLVSGKYIC